MTTSTQSYIAGAPGVADMTRPGAGTHRHDIETDGHLRKSRALGDVVLRGSRNARLLPGQHGLDRETMVRTDLDLDEAKYPTGRARHEIDLA
jgi:hypothetical protein